MRKSLELQAELGPVFDVTLDCEDGAPVGGEAEHAHLVAEMVMSAENVLAASARACIRSAIRRSRATCDHRRPRGAASRLPDAAEDRERRRCRSRRLGDRPPLPGGRELPLHALIETHGALREVAAIAAHRRASSRSRSA